MIACSSREPLPPLPAVDTSRFFPSIKQSVDTAIDVARAKPYDPDAVGRLGMMLHAHDELASARDCYRRASILDPKRFEWRYYLGLTSEGEQAVASFRAAIHIRNDLAARLKLGEALLAAGDFKGAREVYRGIDHPAALFGYGRATNDMTYYERALSAFPQFGAAQFALAQHYQRLGRIDHAKRLFASYERFKLVAPPVADPAFEAVRALNHGPDALLREAAEFERRGQLDQAIELQERALAVYPKLAQAHTNLISLYGRQNDAVAVHKHYEDAIALDPKAHDAYYNYGVFCYVNNRRKEAQTAFEKTIELNPGHAGAHTNVGAILQEQGQLADAARHFAKAVELQPNQHLARFHLGRIYANQGRFTNAIEQFERAAAASDGAAPTYLYALGATQARAGDVRAAVQTLAAAKQKAVSVGQSELASTIDRDLKKLTR